MSWFLKVVKDNYANFNGRAGRQEFWMFMLFSFLIYIAFMILSVVLGFISEKLVFIPSILMMVFALGILVPSIAVGVRRMHDTGRSGWWVLTVLIPFVGGIVYLILCVLPSQPEENIYGPSPV